MPLTFVDYPQTTLSDMSVDNTNKPESQPSQPDLSEQKQQVQKDEKPIAAAAAAATTPTPSRTTESSGPSSTLANLEAQLSEMTSIMDDVPLQKMQPEFRKKYLAIMDNIETKKKEHTEYIAHMVKSNRLSEADAAPFMKVFESNDGEVESKRPIFGFVEASYEDFKRREEENRIKVKRIEDHNKILKEEKDQYYNELESMKKKMRLNDYNTPASSSSSSRFEESTPVQQQQQQQQQESTKSTSYNLLDHFNPKNNTKATTVVIRDTVSQGLFDYDMSRRLITDEAGIKRMDQLKSFMKNFS